MIDVHFELNRTQPRYEELGEAAAAHLVETDADFAALLCESDGLDGALVIGDATLGDDLAFLVQHLCFEAVAALRAPGATYVYAYFSSDATAQLAVSADGATIEVTDGEGPVQRVPRAELLPALYACGERFLAFVEALGRRGRGASAADLAALRPEAARAKAAL